jgi:hypothetical protein
MLPRTKDGIQGTANTAKLDFGECSALTRRYSGVQAGGAPASMEN